jgi:protein-S-isoprenylcysteine O-methyltransferase Ste14
MLVLRLNTDYGIFRMVKNPFYFGGDGIQTLLRQNS